MKTLYKITQLIKECNIDKLTEKEIDYFIDQHYSEWVCRYDLSPCGDLTVVGKKEYIIDNHETIMELLDEFPNGGVE